MIRRDPKNYSFPAIAPEQAPDPLGTACIIRLWTSMGQRKNVHTKFTNVS
jgi:hypothetical protein